MYIRATVPSKREVSRSLYFMYIRVTVPSKREVSRSLYFMYIRVTVPSKREVSTLAKWLLEFLRIPRIFLGIPRNKGVNFHGKFGLGIPRNS